MNTLKVRIHSATDTGKLRSLNEDRLAVVLPHTINPDNTLALGDEEGILMAIADGMGGTNAGEVAAGIAIDTIQTIGPSILSVQSSPEQSCKQLEGILLSSHTAIADAINAENKGMGTTMVVALLKNNNLFLCWSGDSRAYRYCPHAIEKRNSFDLPHLQILTSDHSVVWDMVKAGELDPNGARLHEFSNIITRSLGDPEKDPQPESAHFTVQAGDKILLCSDGLNSMLPDEYIEAILSHDEDDEYICKSLIDAANHEGGHDNITIILVTILEAPPNHLETNALKDRQQAITAKADLSLSKIVNESSIGKMNRAEKILASIIAVSIVALLYYIWMDKPWAQDSPGVQKSRDNTIKNQQEYIAHPDSSSHQASNKPDTVIQVENHTDDQIK